MSDDAPTAKLKPAIINDESARMMVDCPHMRFAAVLFRRRLYIACGHSDAITLAFEKMSELAKHNVSCRIGEDKEQMLFGYALGDGTEWAWEEKYQRSRMSMYGFI